MSVFLLALVGPAALETSLLSLGFVDFFFLLLPYLVHFIFIFSLLFFFLQHLFG